MTRRRIDHAVQEAINLLLLEEWTPPEILEGLKVQPELAGRVPVLRTVQRMAKERRNGSGESEWTFLDSDPGEARLVLPVLAAVMEQTKGRRMRLSLEVAELVVRIQRATDFLEPWAVYGLAVDYLAAKGTDREVHLDAILALSTRDPELVGEEP